MKTDDPFYNWFVLNHKLPSPSVLKRLLEQFGSSAEIIDRRYADEEVQEEYDCARDAEQICLDDHITTITVEDPNYPANLKQIPAPPTILYARGNAPARNEKIIAIVGSRTASKYTLSQAKGLAKKFTDSGITVISGMAKGSDMAAHKGALYVHKRTIAVLGTSLTFKRTKEEQKTIDDILANNGCILSEVEPWENYGPGKHGANLVKRNRITTALSDAVIITECDEKSGTMHAIKYAQEQGKPIYAIPPLPGKSNYSDHMNYLQRNGILQFLEKGIGKQILLNISRNCRA